jgi:hypothetical protein
MEVPDNVTMGSQEFLDLLAKARAGGGSRAPAGAPVTQGGESIPTGAQGQQNLLDTPIPVMDPKQADLLGRMNPGLGQIMGDQTATTLSGVGGAVARGNPLTQMAGMVGDLAEPIVRSLSGGKTGAGMDPNSTVLPSQQIQQYLTSLGVQNPSLKLRSLSSSYPGSSRLVDHRKLLPEFPPRLRVLWPMLRLSVESS